MATHYPPKKNDTNGYVFYVSLASQANTKVFQANPTLAAGDIQVAVDDDAPANVDAQAVDADFTKRVKITLSQAQTNGDNLTVIFSDAAGDEWCDHMVNIQTSAQTLDEIDTNIDTIKAVTDVLASLDAIADAVWDEAITGAAHNGATVAGRRLRQAADVLIAREETCQAGGGNAEVILDASASGSDDFYIYDIIVLTSGTGAGQSRHIEDYDQATKTCTVNRDWDTNPDATTGYVIRFDSTKHVHSFATAAKAEINTECDSALADYDPPTKTEMDTAHDLLATEAKQDIIDTNVDAMKLKTDLLPNGFIRTAQYKAR